jgi:hypothetical protein
MEPATSIEIFSNYDSIPYWCTILLQDRCCVDETRLQNETKEISALVAYVQQVS